MGPPREEDSKRGGPFRPPPRKKEKTPHAEACGVGKGEPTNSDPATARGEAQRGDRRAHQREGRSTIRH